LPALARYADNVLHDGVPLPRWWLMRRTTQWPPPTR
jgi:hypothetical protein